MCISIGAPKKPAYGPCNETHGRRWQKVKVPIMPELTARCISENGMPDMVTINYKEEWRYC